MSDRLTHDAFNKTKLHKMKKQKIFLMINLLYFAASTQAQKVSVYTKSLNMTNGTDTIALLPRDQLPYSFFKLGKVRTYEDSACTSYLLNIVFYKEGKGRTWSTNHYQWRDTIVQTLISIKPDSLMFLKNVHANKKTYTAQFFIKVIY
jgi:hypothetical protein